MQTPFMKLFAKFDFLFFLSLKYKSFKSEWFPKWYLCIVLLTDIYFALLFYFHCKMCGYALYSVWVFFYCIHLYYSLNNTHTPSGTVSFQCAHKSRKYLCEFCLSYLSFGCAVSWNICFYCGYPAQWHKSTAIHNNRLRTGV